MQFCFTISGSSDVLSVTVLPFCQLQFIMYCVCSLCCTLCAVYDVLCVQFMKYFVCSLCCTVCAVYDVLCVQFMLYRYSQCAVSCTVRCSSAVGERGFRAHFRATEMARWRVQLQLCCTVGYSAAALAGLLRSFLDAFLSGCVQR